MVVAFGVTDLAQPNCTCHVLKFAVAVGGTGEAVEGVVRYIELHDTASQSGQFFGLRSNRHAFGNGLSAGSVKTASAFDFHHAKPARAKRVEAVG